MYETSVAILHCTEYNLEKLKVHWGEPESPEQALRWRLEGGIIKCVEHLLLSEIYHWNKLAHRCYWNIRNSKNMPVKLRKILVKLMNNSISAQTEAERIIVLKKGIKDTVIYLQKIKNNKSYLNSKALQEVKQHLKSLLELEISQ